MHEVGHLSGSHTHATLPRKLDLLESSGLITVDDIDRRATCIRLTDKGRRISDHLVEMQAIMADTGT